ncbi:hypothetical protein HY631_04180 [Candidatus Uhrbacteria bacterium]|nr:hypothetical protein [Candidatus Uhrbacteria bacterium]
MFDQDTTLGELVQHFYEEFLVLYGDEELASVATAAVINDLLAEGEENQRKEALGQFARNN